MAVQFDLNGGEIRLATGTRPSACEVARIRELAQSEIGFVHNPEFETMTAADLDDHGGECVSCISASRDRVGSSAVSEPTIPATRLLQPEEERRLFRRYNFLKYRANVLRSLLHDDKPSRDLVAQIEVVLRQSNETREALVRSNMRLAASIARRYSRNENDFDELLAEASVILLNAVEKFDYSRGFRFSTYATHAIQRHLFRVLQRRQKRSRRERKWQESQAPAPEDNGSDTPVADAEALHRLGRLWERADECLTSREQSILQQRFGLGGTRKPQTLNRIAGDIGLSKERVRQIQLQALDKLRRFALDEGLWIEL